MDSLITAAARALAAGDPLEALNWIARRDDAAALALRGIAMAQMGDLPRARTLVRSAARAFGPRERVARARCIVAEAEIALASRELNWPASALEAARATLDEHGDRVNAAHAQYLQVRRLLLLGQLESAERAASAIDPSGLPTAARAALELVVAGIELRRIRASRARAALERATLAAEQAGISGLLAEVKAASRLLEAPAAHLVMSGATGLLTLGQVEALFASQTLVIDACRHLVRQGATAVSLSGRPVLFSLVRQLAAAWPEDVSRDVLVARIFRARRADESQRARLRVEAGRLRRILRPLAEIRATRQGFLLVPRHGSQLAVLAPPVEGDHAEILALLCDGESWSSSALALALGSSQRTVQRALDALLEKGKVQPLGKGRARRWMTPPLPGFAPALLLPTPLPTD